MQPFTQQALHWQHKTVVQLRLPVKPIEKVDAGCACELLHSPLDPAWISRGLERQDQRQVLLVNGVHVRLTDLGHVEDVIAAHSLVKQFTHKGLWHGLVKDLHT